MTVLEKEMFPVTREMRRDILSMGNRCGSAGAHMGGCMSLVELLAVLYKKILNMGPEGDPEKRDRVILSKGHAGIALYAALYQAGLLTREEIRGPMRGEHTVTYRHPKKNTPKGIEVSTGSLGLGLGYGIGVALALRRRGNLTPRIFVIFGDGECNEGSVWESAALAGQLCLQNMTVIVDQNHLQLDGFTKDIIDNETMASRWASFGFDTVEIDGHDVNAIYNAMTLEHCRPLAIIAHTVKGKGISYMENRVEWHDRWVTDELLSKGLAELERDI